MTFCMVILTRGVYPSKYDTNKKRSLRRKAVHYSVDNGELFSYIGDKRHPRRVIIQTDGCSCGVYYLKVRMYIVS